jgi:two-component system, NtrC family, sensor kinase
MTENTSEPRTTPNDMARSKEKQAGNGVAPHLAAMGQLAAGIAHEINTPAQYVSDNIYFLQDAFDGFLKVLARYQAVHQAVTTGSDHSQTVQKLETTLKDEDIDYLLEQVPEAIQQSLEGMTRITQIVEAMRDFSHPGLMEKKVVDINKAIRNTVMVTRNLWKYSSDLETDLDETLPSVPCQPGEINQVLLNLIVNAADAVSDAIGSNSGMDKGKIRISTTRIDAWVEIQISDTGMGIPESIQGKIFDPFYTTKPVGKGTGQGLAIAASVIAHHGGTLTFETVPGNGTIFHIRLPLEEKDVNQT